MLENFIGLLRDRGLGQTEIDQMLVHNPARACSSASRVAAEEFEAGKAEEMVVAVAGRRGAQQ